MAVSCFEYHSVGNRFFFLLLVFHTLQFSPNYLLTSWYNHWHPFFFLFCSSFTIAIAVWYHPDVTSLGFSFAYLLKRINHITNVFSLYKVFIYIYWVELLIPSFTECSKYHSAVARWIQLKITIRQLLQILSWIDLVLEDHLEHGVPQVSVWIIGFLDDSEAMLIFRQERPIVAAASAIVWPLEEVSMLMEYMVEECPVRGLVYNIKKKNKNKSYNVK